MDTMNLKKLAGQSGLSVSTESKAFQDSYEISAATKERVLRLARELNYQPNPLASSLRKQKSRTIVLVIPEITNSFFSVAKTPGSYIPSTRDDGWVLGHIL
jgi:LacI family transcriptional regulator